jgi:hypothetical protein
LSPNLVEQSVERFKDKRFIFSTRSSDSFLMVFASWHRPIQKPFGPCNVTTALIITTRKIFTDAHVAHIARERR